MFNKEIRKKMIGYDETKRKSNRALEAEENGFKKEHVFSRINKMDRDRYYIALNNLEATELPEVIKSVKKIFGI